MMGTTRFMHAKLASDKPILTTKTKIDHNPPHPVTQILASSRQIVLILANKTVQRIDVTNPEKKIENIDLTRYFSGSKYRVHLGFLDSFGHHLLISLKSQDGDNLRDIIYIPSRNHPSGKPKISSKIRGHLVTAVGWNPTNNSINTTGAILMGTDKGDIFEAEISCETGILSSGFEKQWRHAHSLTNGGRVTGIEVHRVPKSKRFFIFVTQKSRLYQFQGVVSGDPETEKPILYRIFEDSSQKPEIVELKNLGNFSYLNFFYEPKESGKLAAKMPLYPRNFGWMTSDGIYHGKIDPYSNKKDSKNELIPLQGSQQVLGFVLTQFHALIAFSNRLQAICLLNEQVIFEDELEMIKGISRDSASGIIYVHSEYSIFKYNLEHEEKNIWKVFLEKKNFEKALEFCFGDQVKMNQVLSKQADDLFQQEKYMEAAQVYAQTKGTDFESVALKFLQQKEHEALLHYLRKRLDLVKASEKIQLTMIIVWLVEIYLNKMSKSSNSKHTKDLSEDDIDVAAEALDDQTSEELLSLMKTPKIAECINQNRNMFYTLLASHGDKTNLIKLASIMNDYDRVIRYHLQDKEYEPVLQVLESQLLKNRPNFFHEYGPTLMQAIPRRFVDSLVNPQIGSRLIPLKMLPSLFVQARPDQELESIRYLEFCVFGKMKIEEAPILNYLISLKVKHQPEQVWDLLQFLGSENIKYDARYTLRIISEKNMHKEAVYLFCVLGHLEEAVTISLNMLSLDEAKNCLKFAKTNENRRKIWLMIAKHVVENEKDIKKAMECLKECDNLVKVEDILPFFPNFVTIDHFKEEICKSLQQYSEDIANLKEEMDIAYGSAERIRQDLAKHKGKYSYVKSTDKCNFCGNYLLSRPFHLFPSCCHKFHTDCLIDQILPHLSKSKQKRIAEIQAELSKKQDEEVKSIDSKSLKLSRRDLLRQELEELIGFECPLCGEMMIKLIDTPFIEDAEFEALSEEWA